MKPYGLRSEQRLFEQQYYGHYCNKAREKGTAILDYVTFKDVLDESFKQKLDNSERMNFLLNNSM